MFNLPNILAIFLALTVALPPAWCRALPICPLPCCDVCAEELEQHGCCELDSKGECDSPQKQNPCKEGCQCGKPKLMKPSDDASTFFAVPAVAFEIVPTLQQPTGCFELEASPDPRDVQKMLCRWTC